MFDEHQKKTMEFIDYLGDLLAKPQPDVPSPMSTNNRLVDRQLESLEDSAQDIRRAVETSGDEYVSTNYLVQITLQGLKREILFIEDYEERKERASRIVHLLFEARVTISRLTEEEKKAPTGDRLGMPMMDGVNLPRIAVPKFDGNILNWRPFWEQFQAAVHEKPHLEKVDKLTYLRDAIYVIQGLTCTNCRKLSRSHQVSSRSLRPPKNYPS